jgi:hypothetical protein
MADHFGVIAKQDAGKKQKGKKPAKPRTGGLFNNLEVLLLKVC